MVTSNENIGMRIPICAMSMNVICLAVLVTLAACSSACSENKFFCLSGKEQEYFLKKASSSQIIEIMDINYRSMRPPLSIYGNELFKRKRDGMVAFISYLRKGGADPALINNVTVAFRGSEYDFCRGTIVSSEVVHMRLREKYCKNDYLFYK